MRLAKHAVVAIMGLWISLTLISAHAGAQDRVWMKNGDVVTGTVKYVSDTDLLVDVYGAEVKLPLGDIQSFSASTPMRVQLADGAIMKGPIVARDGGGIRIKTPEGMVSVSDLSTLGDMYDPENLPESKKRWIGRFTASASVSGGNTRQRHGRADLDVRGDLDDYRLTFLAGGEYGDSAARGSRNRVLNTRRAFGHAQIDVPLSERLYAYGRVRFEGDEFQNLTLRSIYGAGLGYRFIDKPHQSLDVAIGASWVTEDNDNGTRDRSYATADGMFDYRVDVTDSITFRENILAFLNLKDRDDFRAISTTSLDVLLSETLALTLQLIYEYDNLPARLPSGRRLKRQDWRFYAGVTYSFW